MNVTPPPAPVELLRASFGLNRRALPYALDPAVRMLKSKSARIRYWIPTAVLALGFAGGGLGDLFRAPNLAQEIASLGYPSYLMGILGVWKLLAAVALLLPGYAQLKEWAYAGIAFDLTGAAVSHLMIGSPLDKVAIPLVFLAIGFASWALRPESRRLPGTFALSPTPASSAGEALAR